VLGFRRGAALFGALAASAAVVVVACSVYDSSLLLPAPVDSGGGQDVVDAGVADAREAEAAPSPCPELFPPPPPATDDPPSDGGPNQTFIVALHTIDVGLGDAGTTRLGYDLDRVYTGCDGGAPSGHGVGPESCNGASSPPVPHPDDPEGRDDWAGHLLATLSSFDPSQFNTTTVSQRLENGTYSVILQILQYNGTANDTQVSVGLYGSSGIADAGAQWNGHDTWTIDQDFVVGDSGPPYLPTHGVGNAYVADGTLVININFPLSLGTSSTGSFEIELSQGLITATVVPTNGTYKLTNGQITGRWHVGDLLSAVQDLTVGGNTLCPGAPYYIALKNYACQYADIMTDPSQDLMGKTCDALSLGIGFTADPALMGAIVATPQHSSLCYPDGGEPDAQDSCQ
jgi:hypothetical protein